MLHSNIQIKWQVGPDGGTVTRRKNVGMTRVKGSTRKEPIEEPGVSQRSPAPSTAGLDEETEGRATVTSQPPCPIAELLSDRGSTRPPSHLPRCNVTHTRFCHTQFSPRGSKNELNSRMWLSVTTCHPLHEERKVGKARAGEGKSPR